MPLFHCEKVSIHWAPEVLVYRPTITRTQLITQPSGTMVSYNYTVSRGRLCRMDGWDGGGGRGSGLGREEASHE